MKNKPLNVLIIRIIREKIWSHATAGITHLKNKYQQKKKKKKTKIYREISSYPGSFVQNYINNTFRLPMIPCTLRFGPL